MMDPRLLAYCSQALQKGYAKKEVVNRLVDAGHDKRLVKQAVGQAHDELKSFAPKPLQPKSQTGYVVVVAVMMLVMVLVATAFYDPQITGLSVADDDGCRVAFEMHNTNGHKGVCKMQLGDVTTVQMMLRNTGEDITRYSVILNGQNGFDHYDYEHLVEREELLIKLFDFDTTENGVPQSLRLVPYQNNMQCTPIIYSLENCI